MIFFINELSLNYIIYCLSQKTLSFDSLMRKGQREETYSDLTVAFVPSWKNEIIELTNEARAEVKLTLSLPCNEE